MIELVRFVHSKRIIHRDLKPDNFVLGTKGGEDRIFLVDFGLAKKYMNSKGEHIKFREGKGLTGTSRYVSISTHLGLEQSRRDDMETLGYVFMYLLRGSLPWQDLKGKDKKLENIKIKDIK